ncbi:hypothetical protein IPF86_03680 [Candidatus Nomurabacteria bacterium]|jgi:hypothetical protein|nr:MAG: hypothetical protein IPF86_03680 [Candidatus Nomurabacteria bacterium]
MIEKLLGKSHEDWKNHLLKMFKDFHDNFSDEIPEQIVHGDNPKNYKYKVRGNWLAGVRTALQNAALLKMFPEDFNTEWKSFYKAWDQKMKESNSTARTTKEEIDIVNNFLIKAQEIISNLK